jgi:hypothetical protein
MKKISLCLILLLIISSLKAQESLNNQKVDGYKGIWFTLGQFSEYGDKYSGGLGTYTAKHRPLAIYSPKVKKTFFVYGGTRSQDEKHLLCMISYYDHRKKLVPKPTVVYDKLGVDDPHDDPSLAIDSEGYLWVFVSGRGRSRPGFKYKSDRPYDISAFSQITEEEMTYPQPVWDENLGFFHFFTKYTGVRELYFETSEDGITWTEDKKLAGIIEEGATKSGHYQVSGKNDEVICTFFNRHPDGNVDRRTDLYYAQTTDFGKTWTTVDGKLLQLPLTTVDCGARLIDYAAEGKNVYMKDLAFDKDGYPICLYVTSGGHQPGPANDPREWRVTYYDGESWQTTVVCQSDHNYDMGSLGIKGNRWRVYGPTQQGPQVYQTGGEVAIWQSGNAGQTWKLKRQITHNSKNNHTYVRIPVDAHRDFYTFWADGDPTGFSKSFLYFSNANGKRVYRLPYGMEEDLLQPTRVKYD